MLRRSVFSEASHLGYVVDDVTIEKVQGRDDVREGEVKDTEVHTRNEVRSENL